MSDHAKLRANAHAIRSVVRQMQTTLGKFECFVDQVISHILSTEDPNPPTPGAIKMLTPRQNEVLRLMARGLGTKDMAREMSLSNGTVKSHITFLYRRLGIATRAEAAVFATRFMFDHIAETADRLEALKAQPDITEEMKRHAKPLLTRRDRMEINAKRQAS